jgi:23S rRNA pseudouridine1911/1915/1917 synthase
MTASSDKNHLITFIAVSQSLWVLYEDNHLLVINKPAGMPTMGAARGQASVVHAAKVYLRKKYKKPGNVYVGVISRLDAFVSGVLVLARTSKAAARLSAQFKQGTVEKFYWALVEHNVGLSDGQWSDYVLKDERAQRMRVVAPDRAGAQHAALRLARIAKPRAGATLLEIQLLTGRKHQIRVQLASRGLPILGDAKYGSSHPFPKGIALHARRLVVEHPVKNERFEFQAPLPSYWRQWANDEPFAS